MEASTKDQKQDERDQEDTGARAAGSQDGAGEGDGERNVGRIEQIQGVVIEAVFPDHLPEINSAITVERPEAQLAEIEEAEKAPSHDEGGAVGLLVCEVQQHLGDDRVRA